MLNLRGGDKQITSLLGAAKETGLSQRLRNFGLLINCVFRNLESPGKRV
jgi:hypothetical protein